MLPAAVLLRNCITIKLTEALPGIGTSFSSATNSVSPVVILVT
jgi:hypothetical protein